MNHPHLKPVSEYAWAGAVNDLAALIVTGWDTPEEIDAIRCKWGMVPAEMPIALIDAELELEKGWGQPRSRKDAA